MVLLYKRFNQGKTVKDISNRNNDYYGIFLREGRDSAVIDRKGPTQWLIRPRLYPNLLCSLRAPIDD